MPGISLRRTVFLFIVRRAVTRRLLLQLLVLYGAVGLVAARSHHYFAHVAAMRSVVSALLAVLLWPLVLLGVDLHLG
jgi:hypothetical protein